MELEDSGRWLEVLRDGFRFALFLDDLGDLRSTIHSHLEASVRPDRDALRSAVDGVLDTIRAGAPKLFLGNTGRRSDFFRDVAGAGFVAEAEALARKGT